MGKIILGIVGVLFVLMCVTGLTVVMHAVGVKNQSIELRNSAKAEEEANKAIFSNMKATISQKAQIADVGMGKFEETFVKIMEARYGGEDRQSPLLKFVTEQNPTFDMVLYKDLSRAVESMRADFTEHQKKLIDIKRTHDNLRMFFPNSIIMNIVGEGAELKITIVTSANTKETFRTGEENDLELFPSNKTPEAPSSKK